MKPIELYEAVKIAANGNREMGMYYIPVKVGDENGQMNPVSLIDCLIRMGDVKEEYFFGVSFQYEEGYFELSEIEIAGETTLF